MQNEEPDIPDGYYNQTSHLRDIQQKDNPVILQLVENDW